MDNRVPLDTPDSAAQSAARAVRVRSQTPDDDLLASPAVGLFLAASQHELYYASINRATRKRDHRPQLLAALLPIAELNSTERDRAAVELLIGDRLKTITASPAQPSTSAQVRAFYVAKRFERLAATHERGMCLLGINAVPTHHDLKVAYRSAAKVHHPDRGGTTQDMQHLNAAFSALAALLAEESETTSTDEARAAQRHPGDLAADTVLAEVEQIYREWLPELLIRSWPAYDFSVRRVLFNLSVDACELDLVRRWFGRLSTDSRCLSWLRACHKLEVETLCLRLPDERLFPVLAATRDSAPWSVGYFVEASQLLRASGDHRCAREIADWVHALHSTQDGLDEDWCQILERLQSEVPTTVGAFRRAKHKSVAWARNAHRFRLIRQEELDVAESRAASSATQSAERQKRCDDYRAKVGFIRLKNEPVPTVDPAEEFLAPESSYFKGAVQYLNVEQYAEYWIAFNHPSAPVELMEKWQWTRMARLREERACGTVYPEHVRREAGFLAAIFPESATRWKAVAER